MRLVIDTNILIAALVRDSIFIALALSTDNQGIWSEDKHFEQQKRVKVLKTKDVMRALGIPSHL